MCSWNMPTGIHPPPHTHNVLIFLLPQPYHFHLLPDSVPIHLTAVYVAFSINPFPLLITSFHPLFVGPPRRLEDSRPKCGTHPPSRIPIRDRTRTLSHKQIFSSQETQPPCSIPTQHGTHPPSRIPIQDRTHLLSHTQFPSRHRALLPIQSSPHGHSSSHGPHPQELSRPLPLPIRGPKSQSHSHPSRPT